MSIKDLIGKDLPEATHMTLEHVKLKEFRFMGVIELPVFTLLFIIFLPVALVLAIVLSLSLESEEAGAEGLGYLVRKAYGKGVRMYTYQHQLILKVYGSNDALLAEAQHIPASREAAENLIFDLLESLHEKKLVLVELIDAIREKSKTNIKEHLVTWYGGRALMALQQDFVEKDCREALLQKGWKLNEASSEVSLCREVKVDEGLWPIWIFVGMHTFLPPTLFLLFSSRYRKHLRDCFLYWHKEKRPCWEFTVKADRLRLTKKRWRRGMAHLEEEVFFDIYGQDLVGICYAAELDYDRDVTYRGKSVKVYTKEGVVLLPKMIGVNFEHICNWLVAVTLRLRSERPELGLGFDPNRPTKCPYCGSIYIFKPGEGCPSCGGWPERIE